MHRSMLYAFDGTWNDDSEPTAWTNVYRLATCRFRERGRYYPGVGSWADAKGSVLTRLIGGAFGNGLSDIIGAAFRDWLRDREHGVTVIDVIGFSRGAMAAIDFAGKIREFERAHRVPSQQRAQLRFLGLLDTVDAIGLPDVDWDPFYHQHPPTGKLGFARAVHAVALHETRATFQVREVHHMDAVVGFIGDHSDIGGGWRQRGLSEYVLRWMFDQAEIAGVDWDRNLRHVSGRTDDRLLPHRVFTSTYRYQPRCWPKGLTVYPRYPHWRRPCDPIAYCLPHYPLLKQVPDHPRKRRNSKQPLPQTPVMKWVFVDPKGFTLE